MLSCHWPAFGSIQGDWAGHGLVNLRLETISSSFLKASGSHTWQKLRQKAPFHLYGVDVGKGWWEGTEYLNCCTFFWSAPLSSVGLGPHSMYSVFSVLKCKPFTSSQSCHFWAFSSSTTHCSLARKKSSHDVDAAGL